ncbi:MAG: hypothetical protein QOJ02_1459 [Acidobacteriota bacterium]|jgi:hypothetical protein|nr:hypothetical protein [Acidobacteriota bacterium]
MLIRFVSGDIDADLHVEKGLFYAAYRLRYADDLPEYELDRLLDLSGWFNINLSSPFEFRLRKYWRSRRAICRFKSSACEHPSTLPPESH